MNPLCVRGAMNIHLNSKGFSLLEMSIALIILGLVTGTVLASYNIEMKKRRFETVLSQTAFLQNAVGVFFITNGHYPRPARLDLAPDHPDYGREISEAEADAIAPGTCLNGVCRLNSDIGAVGGTILHGAIPAKALRITDDSMIDPWKNKYSYVVTQSLTGSVPFDRMAGNIRVMEISPERFVAATGTVAPKEMITKYTYINPSSPPAGHFLIFSHGENGNGSFTVAGVLNSDSAQIDIATGVITRLCDPSLSDESENCDNDGRFVFSNYRYYSTTTPGLVATSAYYDDFMVASNGVASSGLWEYVASGDDIYSNAPVGIRTQDVGVQLDADGNIVRNALGAPIIYGPAELPYATDTINLDVNGNVRLPHARVNQICNLQGDACFQPAALGGAGIITCDDGSGAQAMSGIAGSAARCATFSVGGVTGTCPAGQVVVGVSSGVVQCGVMAGM